MIRVTLRWKRSIIADLQSKDQPQFLSRNDLHDSKGSIYIDKNGFGYPNSVSSLYETVKN